MYISIYIYTFIYIYIRNLRFALSYLEIYTTRKFTLHTCVRHTSLQHAAKLCRDIYTPSLYSNTLQHTAAHCNILQRTATHCNTLYVRNLHCKVKVLHLQCVAVCCSVLQYVAVCCSVLLQCVKS